MYALINEIYDLKRRSFYNQRLLKVSNGDSRVNRMSVCATPQHSNRKPENMADLNEHVILKSMDNKKTYYNSILSNVKPKFRYKMRRGNR